MQIICETLSWIVFFPLRFRLMSFPADLLSRTRVAFSTINSNSRWAAVLSSLNIIVTDTIVKKSLVTRSLPQF